MASRESGMDCRGRRVLGGTECLDEARAVQHGRPGWVRHGSVGPSPARKGLGRRGRSDAVGLGTDL